MRNDLANLAVNKHDKHDKLMMEIGFCMLMGFIIGATIGFLTMESAGFSKDVTHTNNAGLEYTEKLPTAMGWVYTGSLMVGLSVFLCSLLAFARSKKTCGEMFSAALAAITPSTSSLQIYTMYYGNPIDNYPGHYNSSVNGHGNTGR